MSREIDRQIAELKGWTVKHIHTPANSTLDLIPWDYDEYQTFDPTGKRVALEGNERIAWQHVPHFSTDWNAMRQLVEWLQGNDIKVGIIHDNGWICTVQKEGKTKITTDDTAPLALCKAVLSLPPEVLA